LAVHLALPDAHQFLTTAAKPVGQLDEFASFGQQQPALGRATGAGAVAAPSLTALISAVNCEPFSLATEVGLPRPRHHHG